ncbi:hypothetical protein V8F20_001836 [Naviculisporaceae sp. PSN 640]
MNDTPRKRPSADGDHYDGSHSSKRISDSALRIDLNTTSLPISRPENTEPGASLIALASASVFSLISQQVFPKSVQTSSSAPAMPQSATETTVGDATMQDDGIIAPRSEATGTDQVHAQVGDEDNNSSSDSASSSRVMWWEFNPGETPSPCDTCGRNFQSAKDHLEDIYNSVNCILDEYHKGRKNLSRHIKWMYTRLDKFEETHT